MSVLTEGRLPIIKDVCCLSPHPTIRDHSYVRNVNYQNSLKFSLLISLSFMKKISLIYK